MSNLIKSSHYIPITGKKKIQFHQLNVVQAEDNVANGATGSQEQQDQFEEKLAKLKAERLAEAERMKQQMLDDAQRQVNEMLQQAEEQSTTLKTEAEEEIAMWWDEKRKEDETIVGQAQEDGYKQGYEEGLKRAEDEVLHRYKEMLDQAQSIVEQSYVHKEQIVSEAEPFLLELSIEIAKKIIGKQYSISSEWVLENIKEVLGRRKEQGVITLCVSPAQFEQVIDAKDELMLALDSQADLHIIPDQRVDDYGCIVRSSYGSIDARIDTQLEELKKALLQAVGEGNQTEGSEDDVTS